jgi:hypothetical protein
MGLRIAALRALVSVGKRGVRLVEIDTPPAGWGCLRSFAAIHAATFYSSPCVQTGVIHTHGGRAAVGDGPLNSKPNSSSEY